MNIDIEYFENFFQDELICGISLKNSHLFENGFSISKADIIDDNQVDINIKVLAENLDCEYKYCKFQKQIHSKIVRKVSLADSNYIESDGLMTNEPGLLLNISLADCCGILLFDREKKAISAVHSGWKGTEQNIAAHAVNEMKNHYQTESKDVYAYLSPCASVESYEVGKDFLEKFPNFAFRFVDDKIFFDNKKMIAYQLNQAGIPQANIYLSGECTISNPKYHSFRRDKKLSGRMSCFIGLR